MLWVLITSNKIHKNEIHSCNKFHCTVLQIRIFKVATGKLIKMLDESLQQLKDLQQVIKDNINS